MKLGKHKKKQIEITVVVIAFIERITKIADESYMDWMQDFIQRSVDCGASSKLLVRQFNSEIIPIRLLYFAAIAALEASCIKNIYDQKTAEALYSELHAKLDHSFKINEKASKFIPVGQLVFDYLVQIERYLDNQSALPSVAVIYTLLEHIGFPEVPKLRPLLDKPTYIIGLSDYVLSKFTSHWRITEENFAIIV